MMKTISLFFILGLMASCASQEAKRDPSSVDKVDHRHYQFTERFTRER